MGLPGLEPDRGVRVAIEISLEAGNFGGVHREATLAICESCRSGIAPSRTVLYCTPFGQLRYLFCLPGEVTQHGHELVRTL